MTILLTGGACFSGSNFITQWAAVSDELVVNINKCPCAGNPYNLKLLNVSGFHILLNRDICNRNLMDTALTRYRPRAIINFVAESHARSSHGPEDFIRIKVRGVRTCAMVHIVSGLKNSMVCRSFYAA